MSGEPYWAGAMGRTWARLQAATDRQLAGLGEMAIGALDPRPGERILDLGCGAGWTTERLARAVGEAGRVTGIDISPDLAAAARGRCAALANVEIVEADAARHPFPPGGHDALFSRLGCIFFAEPAAAFANIRAGLAPGARTVLVAFADPAENPWASLPAHIAAGVLGRAAPEAPGIPGPFGWAEREVFEQALTGAGFAELAAERRRTVFSLGAGEDPDPVARAIAAILSIGVVARRLNALGEAERLRLRPALEAALAEGLAPHVSDGWVRLGALVWLITARA